MKNKIRRALRFSKKFRKEHKKEIRSLVTFTMGFTIAFAWRQAFFDNSQNFLQFLLSLKNSMLLNILTATLITLVSLGLLRLSSYLLKDD